MSDSTRFVNGYSPSPQQSLERRTLLQLGMAAVAGSALGFPAIGLAASAARHRVVETENGKLRGLVHRGLATFKGIAYGGSTAGSNRFLPPQPVRPWRGIRDALALGDQCPQVNLDYPAWLDESKASENCLALNVWAPAHAHQSARLPVIVWIHGGGYGFGSAGAPLYDCGEIVRGGNVVAVGINHRLNIFGYTLVEGGDGGQFAGSANAGQLDLVAALHWVRDNIEAFGGDPANITLFGESGGGGKISALLGMEAARGLFHKAIVQSGSILKLRETAEAEQLTQQVYAKLGIRHGDVAALQAVPAGELLKGWEKVVAAPASIHSSLAFGPTIDGRIFTDQPWAGSAPAMSRNLPMIIGVNLHETVGFIGPDLKKSIGSDEMLIAEAAKYSVIESADVPALERLLAAIRNTTPSLSQAELLVRLSTEIGFRRGAIRQADLKVGGGGRAYMYECDWKTPCFDGLWSPHGIEIPFVFNRTHYGTTWDGQDTDAKRAAADPRGERFRVGKQMFDAWINFARTGNPSTAKLPWPAYDLDRRPTMVFGASSGIVNDLRSELRIAAASS